MSKPRLKAFSSLDLFDHLPRRKIALPGRIVTHKRLSHLFRELPQFGIRFATLFDELCS